MALCLTRKKEESIILRVQGGMQIKIVVAEINQGRTVKLAVTAPPSVEVVREELLYATDAGWKGRGTDTHGQDIR
jgi:carbon storage regulator CsrA